MSALGPNVAGRFYPGDAAALEREAARLLGREDGAAPDRELRALVVPHAGWEYSGATAAQAFRRLRGRRPERVLIIGPSHYAGFAGAALPRQERYLTPLGELRIDDDLRGRLAGKSGFTVDDAPFAREHSLEVELPFLQRLLPAETRWMLMLIGAGSCWEDNQIVARELRELFDAQTLWIVSTDFTHFGRAFGYAPFEDRIAERIRQLDRSAIDPMLQGDAAGFERIVDTTGITICGRHAVDVLLRVLPRGLRGELLAYENSGNLTGDWTHCVSYAAASFETGDAT